MVNVRAMPTVKLVPSAMETARAARPRKEEAKSAKVTSTVSTTWRVAMVDVLGTEAYSMAKSATIL